jgi:hypothetical protein
MVVDVTTELAARAMTVAKMGPTQGAHTKPRLTPTNKPPENPVLVPRGATAIRELSISHALWRGVIRRSKPAIHRIAIERTRNQLASIPIALTTYDRRAVARVKLTMKPVIMPIGRCLLSGVPLAKIIGKRGRIQGERIVTNPAMKAYPITMNMTSL